MANFKVTWIIDVEADSAKEAAEQALKIHRDPASIATVFYVQDENGNTATVDLNPEYA